jgi:transposase
LKQRLEQARERLVTEGRKQINLTDADATVMLHRGKVPLPSYNGQIAVEESRGVIVAATVSTSPADQSAVVELVEQTQKNTGETPQRVLADSGFSSAENLQYLEDHQMEGYIPDQKLESIQRGTHQHLEFHKSRFSYQVAMDQYTCPQGETLGYWKTDSSTGARIYRTFRCLGCINRFACTKSTLRTISRFPHEEVLVRRQKRMQSPEGQLLYGKRKTMVEPVFGHLKHNLKYRDLLLRGKFKATGEFLLMCIGHNLQKMTRYLSRIPPSPLPALKLA